MRVKQGQSVKLVGTFRQSGTLFDPTAVKLSVRRPGGKVATYVYGVDGALVKDSTGLYHLNQLLNLAGIWFYRWFSDTLGQESADEQQITVDAAKAIQTPDKT